MTDSAFPYSVPPEFIQAEAGLTKREWFAGIILQGMLAQPETGGVPSYDYDYVKELPKRAIEYADSLLKELNK